MSATTKLVLLLGHMTVSPAHALLMHTCGERRAVLAPPRHDSIRCSDWWPPPAGVVVTALSGCVILLRPESALWELIRPSDQDELDRAAASTQLRSLCRVDGWQLLCDLKPPRERGVATKLLYGDTSTSRDVTPVLTLDLALQVDPRGRGFEGQGPVQLLRPSRFIEATGGAWTAGPTADAPEAPWAVQLRLKSSNEFVVGDETVAAGTTLYFDANLESDSAAARVAALSGEGSRLDGLDDGLRLRGGKIKASSLVSIDAVLIYVMFACHPAGSGF